MVESPDRLGAATSSTSAFRSAEAPASGSPSVTNNSGSLDFPHVIYFLLLPAIAMSLGWGLRGTIGGGQIGAMIPGAIVTLCLCHLLGWNRSIGVVAALGTVGVGLGGQETYGQTIGFLRDSNTVVWGLAGLTIKGAMWGLSGGVLVGLGLMRSRYRPREIALGLILMIIGTTVGWLLVDQPKLAYFSNRVDKPREELWVGLTLGALSLLAYLALLQKESISTAFALGGMFAGGAGFGVGGAFIALGFVLPDPYRAWPWWKVMEFTFGWLYGLGLGTVCYRYRRELRTEGNPDRSPALDRRNSAETTDARRKIEPTCGVGIDQPLFWTFAASGLLVAVGGLWLNFSLPTWEAWLGRTITFRPTFSAIAPLLILLALSSNRLGWQIALCMTASGFIRDFLRREVERGMLPTGCDGWLMVTMATIPVVVAVTFFERNGRLTPARALLAMCWLSTLFGLAKVAVPFAGKEHLFVPAVFVVEALLTTALVYLSRAQEVATGSSP